MLKNISPLISPELLMILHKMGHGDEIVLADAHFPADTCNDVVLRADGIEVAALMAGIIPLFALDDYVEDKAVMMSPAQGDEIPEGLVEEFMACLPEDTDIHFIDRFAFYERAQKATCIVITGTMRKYGNIILKKGVTPC